MHLGLVHHWPELGQDCLQNLFLLGHNCLQNLLLQLLQNRLGIIGGREGMFSWM